MKLIAVAVGCFILGAACAGIWQEHRIGWYRPVVERGADGATMYGWPTPSRIREDVVDQDNDGIPEFWSISALGRTDYGITYSIHDEDENRIADDRLLLFSPRAALMHLDVDEDGTPSTWKVQLPAIGEGFYWYDDINGDGVLDAYLQSETDAAHALVDNTWRLVLSKPEGALRTTCTVDIDGEETAVEFIDGAWRPQIQQNATPAAQ